MKLQIKGKLFIAILFTNLVMIGCLYFLITWSFSSSFKTYLDSHQENSLMPLVSALSEQHALKGNWDWIDSQRDLNWRDLIDKYMSDEGQVRERRGGGRGKRGRPPQRFEEHQLTPPDWQDPEPPPPSNRQNLLLADSDKSVIIGPPNRELIYVNWIAIQSNNKTVGFLGYRKINEITSEVDQAFVSKLISDLSWSLIAVIILTALVTLELARRFIKPIKRLSKATHSLASGNYSVKLSEESNDEIGDLSRDFNQLASTLETNLSVRKKWISDISHELRTPVAVLRAEIEAVQDGVRQVSDETVDSLHKEILRLTRLINDLHDLSLSDKGALSYHYEKIDINEIIKILIDSEKDKIGKNNLEMEYSSFFTLKPIYISGDEGRITQLFTNLLNNTRLYTNSGGKLQINGEVVDNDLVIIWSDSEPGVSTEQLDKLFDRLYRVETSRNRNTGGSGLGLAICKNIVEAHQGTIVANHSKIGGIEINISLPIWRK